MGVDVLLLEFKKYEVEGTFHLMPLMLYVGGDPIFTHFFNLISLNNFKFFISLRSVNLFECLFRVFETPIFFSFFLSVHSTYHL